jgi:hypothetical protein
MRLLLPLLLSLARSIGFLRSPRAVAAMKANGMEIQ